MAVALMMAALAPAQSRNGGGNEWALHDGDRVLFYGDSITEQHLFTWWVELFAVTRFPSHQVTFWNAGVGGDRVSGGGGGPVDQRLQRDVFPRGANVFVSMLGMNDGRYAPLISTTDDAYRAGYEHILSEVAQHGPGTRVLLVGPSPYDETTHTDFLIPGGYNTVLLHFGDVDRALAASHHASFADANRPFTAALSGAAKEDAIAAQLLVPDRVHPENAAHLLIAAAILEAWHAPALVSRTELDAEHAVALPGSAGAQIQELSANQTGVRWTSTEEALPWPMNARNAAQGMVLRHAPLEQDLNQELLAVHGLPAGSYKLLIDDREIVTHTAAEWAAGVNLAELRTPMYEQAEAAGWTLRDKCDLQFVQQRIAIEKSSEAAVRELEKVRGDLDAKVHVQVQPHPHRFVLAPVSASSAVVP